MMNRWSALVLCLASVACALPPTTIEATPDRWIEALARVEQSLVRIILPERAYLNEQGEEFLFTPYCTGFSIDRLRQYILTVAHCLDEAMTVDDKPIVGIMWADPILDIAVVHAQVSKPILVARLFTPKGLSTAALGYGYGLGPRHPIFRHAFISEPDYIWPKEGPWTTYDHPFVGGMSGGPIVDLEGRVVGVVSMSDLTSGFSRTMVEIYRSTQQYWQF